MSDPADELFACRPDDFVAARNALVRRLRADGDRDAAAEVAAWRRPTPGAWALNQVARAEPDLVRQLVEAAAALRAATEQALNGDASALRPAQEEERGAIDAVMVAADRQLQELGGSAHETTRRRMVETLHAAGTDPEASALLQSGRLSTDMRAPSLGLDGLSAGWGASDEPAAAPGAARPPRKAGAEDQLAERRAAKRAEREDRAAEAAEDEARDFEARATAARTAADQAEAAASAAERAAARARDRAEKARDKAARD